MSYIQITTRCNMLCEHCCFSCTAKGEDMEPHIFRHTLNYLSDIGKDYAITIGGGEPTVSRYFREVFKYLENNGYFYNDYEEYPRIYVITNGKKVADALYLAKLARHGKIQAKLSLDPWHDPISQRVIDAFTKNVPAWDYVYDYGERVWIDEELDQRGINDGAYKNGVDMIGRAATSNQGWPNIYRQRLDHLCCGGPFIKPDGTINICSCNDHPKIWNVGGCTPPRIIEDIMHDGYCYHQAKEKIEEKIVELGQDMIDDWDRKELEEALRLVA